MPGSWNPPKLLVPYYIGNFVIHRIISEYGENLKDDKFLIKF